MAELVSRLKKEVSIEIDQYEVWHNEENLKKMQEYDKGLCGGVPFFINTGSGKFICGETSYENLLPAVIPAIRKAHPYEEPPIDITPRLELE